MFSSLFSSNTQPSAGTLSAQPTFGALPSSSAAAGQPDLQAACNGAQQRMQAIQSMYSASFLAFSYVLADSPGQIQQVYNAGFQQSVHQDAGKWHEAKVKNPDSEFAYPQPIYGFSALSERSKQQKAHLNNLVAAADNAKTQILNLKAHTERIILAELSNSERRNLQLSSQLAKLMLSIEQFGLHNCKASVDFQRHRELLEKTEKVAEALSYLHKKLQDLKSGQNAIQDALKQRNNAAAPSSSSSSSSSILFHTLKDSVNKKMDTIYHAVLDRCRAVSAQAMHERLSGRSKTFLADLKREYISGKSASGVKLRTMTGFELEILKLLASIPDSDEPYRVTCEVARLAQSPPHLFGDLWQATAHICGSSSRSVWGYLRGASEFLEYKFAEEISALNTNDMSDKKAALFAYCRQRTTIRAGENEWIWFAIYCAFRAGWSWVISEILAEKVNLVPDLDRVCPLLVDMLENGSVEIGPDFLISHETKDQPYKTLLFAMICEKKDLSRIKISQLLPDCTAMDWIWFGLRCVLSAPKHEVKASLKALQTKIDSLPLNYFDGDEAPLLICENLGLYSAAAPTGNVVVRSRKSSKSALQLALMHTLTLDFGKAVQVALKTPEEHFDINDPFHRFALFASMCFDRFGVFQCVQAEKIASPFDASELVLEAALTVAVVQERNEYASAVSASCGKKLTEQLARLDQRRNSSAP